VTTFLQCLQTALVCFSLLNPRVSYGQDLDEPSLYEALIQHGLIAYAKFLSQYAPEVAEEENILVYAPNDRAVEAYLEANPQQLEPDSELGFKEWFDELLHKILPRAGASPNANSAARGNTGAASGGGGGFRGSPSRGSTNGGGTSGAKVSRPSGRGSNRHRLRGLDYVGTITSGGGSISYVLEDSTEYDNGWFFELDSFTAPGLSFQETLADPKIAHLAKILQRIPHTRDIIFGSYNHTFFLPTAAALEAAGLDPDTASEDKLQEFVENHSILNSPEFIGYTPEFGDGACYRAWSGKAFTSNFLGIQTILNGHVTILVEDIITDKGVIQVIDQLLFDGHHPYIDCA